MSQVYQRVMADGDWELNLSPDCPRAVLDKLEPFTVEVVITPGEIDVTSTDSAFLAAARYVGVVRRFGRNRLNPGGPGLSMWLGDPDGKGQVIVSKVTLTSASLSSAITTLLPTATISTGTITSPGGTYSNAYQFVTRRDAINDVCRSFGVEWRINPDHFIDVATVANLYNTTPLAVVARGVGGRDTNVVGIRADLETSVDWEEYASLVYVIGNGVGTSGGASPFRRPLNGSALTWTRVVQDPQTPAGGLTAVADAVFDLLQTDSDGRRELRVSTDLFDVAGDVGLGDNVYVWDPENGIVDTGNEVHYQGQLIYPVTLRCVGIRWPVRRGMGVYLRIQNSTGTPTYENITPYVEFSEGASELELGAASRMLASDQAGQISEVTGQVKQAPWLTYTPTLTGSTSNPTLGSSVLTGSYRREGTTLHIRGELNITTGGSWNAGSGEWRVSLPSGMDAVADQEQQVMGQVVDANVGRYPLHATLDPASFTDRLRLFYYPTAAVITSVTNTAPATWATGDRLWWNGTIEVDP